MTDPSQMTDAELMAAIGDSGSASQPTDLSSIPDDQLLRMIGRPTPKPKPEALVANEPGDASTPWFQRLAMGTGGDAISAGLSEVSQIPKSLAKGVAGLGDLAALGGKALSGQLIPEMLAQKYLGVQAPESISSRVEGLVGKPEYSTGLGRYAGAATEMLPTAALGGGIPSAIMAGLGAEAGKDIIGGTTGELIGSAIGGLSPGVVSTIGTGLKGRAAKLYGASIGARPADFAKSQRVAGLVEDSTGELETKLNANLKDVMKENAPSIFESTQKTAAKYGDKIKTLQSQIGDTLAKADEARGIAVGATIHPNEMENSLAFLDRVKDPVQKKALKQYLNDTVDEFTKEWDGSISQLNGKKASIASEAYTNEIAGVKNAAQSQRMRKAIAKDLDSLVKEKMEAALPGSANKLSMLNKEYGKYSDITKITSKDIPRAESKLWNTEKLVYTSGGVGGSALLMTAPIPTLALAALAYGANTKAGLRMRALLDKGIGTAMEKAGTSSIKPTLVTGAQSLLNPAQEPQQGAVLAPQGKEVIMPESKPTEVAAKLKTSIIDPILQKAVIAQESGGKADAVSNKGAVGLMQLLPSTAKEVFTQNKGLLSAAGHTELDLKNPEQNKILGSLYLSGLIKRYGGDTQLALAAYNWGMGNVDRTMKKYDIASFDDLESHLPSETKTYVGNITRKVALLNKKGASYA